MEAITSPEQVIRVIDEILASEFEIEASRIVASARLREDLGLDSLDGVDLVVALEKALGVQIPEEIARQMKSVGDIHNYVSKAAAAMSAAKPNN
jgi:acyl carrier protein